MVCAWLRMVCAWLHMVYASFAQRLRNVRASLEPFALNYAMFAHGLCFVCAMFAQ
jgi:hypothetical protein